MANHDPNADPEGFRLSTTSKKGYVRGIDALGNFKLKEVEYIEADGEAVFEGCIVLGTTEEMDELTTKIDDFGGADMAGDVEAFGLTRTGQRFLWPMGVVPYKIHPNLPNKARVTDAIDHWQQKSKMQFVERNNEPDFITFRPANGCSSRVGRATGEQFPE